MSAGQVVTAPDGTQVTLVDIGTSLLLETPDVRIWDVSLAPGQLHPWHLHHNPYVVLSIAGGHGRMDWLDGREPRHVREHTGGTVFRPVSPVHRLTSLAEARYRNRLVELRALGELRADGPVDVGPGERSVQDAPRPPAGPDGRVLLLEPGFVTISTVVVPADGQVQLQLDSVPHVLARLDATAEGDELAASVRQVPPGPLVLRADGAAETWFVLALDHLAEPASALKGPRA